MKFNSSGIPEIFFVISITKLKLDRLADSGIELYNVASSAAYMCVCIYTHTHIYISGVYFNCF